MLKPVRLLVLFLPVCLFYYVIFPPFAAAAWVFCRLTLYLLRWPSDAIPYWLETPWDTLLTAALALYCIKMVDADGLHSTVLPSTIGVRCAVLCNHRS